MHVSLNFGCRVCLVSIIGGGGAGSVVVDVVSTLLFLSFYPFGGRGPDACVWPAE